MLTSPTAPAPPVLSVDLARAGGPVFILAVAVGLSVAWALLGGAEVVVGQADGHAVALVRPCWGRQRPSFRRLSGGKCVQSVSWHALRNRDHEHYIGNCTGGE